MRTTATHCPTWCDGADHDLELDDPDFVVHSVTRWVAGAHGLHPVQVRVTREKAGLLLNVGAEAYVLLTQVDELVETIHQVAALASGVREDLEDLPQEQLTAWTQDYRDAVGGEVRAAMARLNAKQAALARRVGMSRASLSESLTGERAFKINELEAIARALDVPILTFFPRMEGR